MGLFRDTEARERAALLEAELGQYADTVDHLEESIAELELALEDVGWDALTGGRSTEFSRDGLRLIARAALLARIKNPLIGRGVRVRRFYTWGQGVDVATDDEDLQEWLAGFVGDLGNRRAVFGSQARQDLDEDLQVDGNVFYTCPTNPSTGRVQVRTIPFAEIHRVITNPDDRSEPWFYERHFTGTTFDDHRGLTSGGEQVEYYPALWHQPSYRPPTIAGRRVRWDSPVLHVRPPGRTHQGFGVSEIYAALDWAKAYKQFLEDWATLVRSLSRFAFKLTAKGGKAGRAEAKRKLGTAQTATSRETNPPPVAGSTFISDGVSNLEAIPKTGATVSAEDGKQLRLMVASAMDLPDTILSGDADQGNRATAETMDRPTELAMASRQTLWADAWTELIVYAAAASIEAPRGVLAGGSVTREDGNVVVLTAEGQPVGQTVRVGFPPVLEPDLEKAVTAIVTAATLDGKGDAGIFPRDALIRRFATTLGFENVDDMIGELEAIAARAGVDASDEDVAEAARVLRESGHL